MGYYLINNGRFALALTVDDNGYMGLDSISLLDFENGWEITNSPMSFMPLGKLRMARDLRRGRRLARREKSISSASSMMVPAAACSTRVWITLAPAGR